MTLDSISQVGVFIFGVSAILLVARKNKWGFVAGILSQPFWFYTAYHHRQWGIFLMNFVYAGTWIYGLYNWFHDEPRAKQTLAKKAKADI